MEFSNILLPIAGSEADEEAAEMACRLANESSARVYAVHVIPIERSLPLDAEIEPKIGKAEQILTKIEDIGAKHGCRMETEMLQSREVGPAIVDEAIEREIDLIIIGMSYKTRFGEFSLGEVIPYVLRNAPCRVIVYHQRKV
jgi:nucleotide-binding universal stress UspA family protein